MTSAGPQQELFAKQPHLLAALGAGAVFLVLSSWVINAGGIFYALRPLGYEGGWTAFGGLVYGLVFMRTRSLMAPVLVHLIHNLLFAVIVARV